MLLFLHKLLKNYDLNIDDIDLWELNEAFAVQVVYCRDKLGIAMDKLNVNGGSISIGHPLGATGTRCLMTLVNAMQRGNHDYGIVTICLGGGNAVAMLISSS